MSRHGSRSVPVSASLSSPARPSRARPVGTATARADGAQVEVSGSMDQLTPIQDEGLRDAPIQSPNLGFNAGGAPVRTIVEEPEVVVPPPKRFRVVKDKIVAHGGHRFTLRAGKEIDASNYDLPMLRRYGVEMVEVQPGEESYS